MPYASYAYEITLLTFPVATTEMYRKEVGHRKVPQNCRLGLEECSRDGQLSHAAHLIKGTLDTYYCFVVHDLVSC